jgi:hypothetical protein
MLLMLLGNAGIISAVSTLILSFVNTATMTRIEVAVRVGALAVGLSLLWTVAHSRWIDDRLSAVTGWTLKRWTDLEICDYAGLLRLSGN